MTFSIAGSRVMMNSSFHDFLLQITFLSPETITHEIEIFQTQQTAPLVPLPVINFNLPRRICVTRDQPRPGSGCNYDIFFVGRKYIKLFLSEAFLKGTFFN
jgi:hypothetical protein